MTHIRVEVDGAVGTITIDRRERFNSLDVETARELRKAGLQMARDVPVRAVVLRGEGGVFCSGADLKDIRAALMYFLGMPLDMLHRIDIAPASISIVTLDGWTPIVRQVNGDTVLRGG